LRTVNELPSGTVTFLFTDIEGSTQLLKQLGPAYGEALDEHQRILRAAFAAHGGQEVDTQGDSFFVAFRRAKDAVAAAADAQRDLAAHPWPGAQPLRVRMGIHTGEPRVSSERYVGLGVHKAARIAAAGHGGQVLVSRTTRDLVEDELPAGVMLADLGERRLKDLDRPEILSQLVIEGLQSEFAPLRTIDEELRRKRRRMYLGSAAIGVLAAAIAIPVFALGQGSSSSRATVAPNSLVAIDSHSNRVIGSVPVGVRPAALAAGDGSIWVVNVEDQTVSRIDPQQLTLQRTVPLTTTPTGIAFGAGGAWVANGPAGSVSRIDPGTNAVTATVIVTNDATAGFPSVGEGSVWVVFANAFLARIDPVHERMVANGLAGTGPSGIAVGDGAIWVANSGDNSVSRILPETTTVTATITVGRHPAGVALGEGGVWVTDQGDDTVTRIDLGSGSETTIQVGGGPTGVAVGNGAVWVANSDDGTISRIDPGKRRVVATIVVGNRPAGVVVAGDRVFASIQATT
jgi:YVTN family beta-propeller protein